MNRGQFDEDLAGIKADFVRMGTMALEMIELSVQAALADDKDLAERVLPMEEDLDRLEESLTERILITMVRESPVAGDLLMLASTLGVVGEIEKAGDDAKKLASRTFKLKVAFPDELKALLSDMDRETRANFRSALALYTNYSPEAAEHLIRLDRTVDDAYRTSRRRILEMIVENPEDKRQLFRCAEIFHALEHISDHSVNIAKTLTIFNRRLSGGSSVR